LLVELTCFKIRLTFAHPNSVLISNVKGRYKKEKNSGQQRYNKNTIWTNLDKTFTLQLENIGLLYFWNLL